MTPRPPATKVGDRVELVATDDKYTVLEPGAVGTVTSIDDVATVHVAWDDGSRLGLIPNVDRWIVRGSGRVSHV
jgi:hypothetical protein